MDRREGFEPFAAGAASHLRRTAFLLTGDAHVAEDLVQDALVALYVAWPRVADPYAYVRRSLVNGTRSRWRYRRRRPETSVAVVHDAAAPGADARTAPPDATDAVLARRVLLDALATLPAKQRAVVVLRHLEDLSEPQTAQALGISVGTVKSQNARALTRLRAALAPDGDPDAARLPEGQRS
ncbi:MAG: SigE family RNA polymerase sigma factor [Actinobacteria bacterium]|nr:SigE family RNA polymerase sigma factor [Actinomycetota bacterium]